MLPFLAAPISRNRIDVMQRDFNETLRRTSMTKDQVARIQGITPQQLSDQLQGQGHLSLTRLYIMKDDPDDRRFAFAYLIVLAESWGFKEAVIALRIAELASHVSLTDIVRDVLLKLADTVQQQVPKAQL